MIVGHSKIFVSVLQSLVPQAIFPNSETGTAIIILVTDPFDLMLLEGPRKSGSRSVLI